MESFFDDLWQAVKQAGPFASMLLLIALYIVNEERKELLKRDRETHERLFTAMHAATDAIRELRDLFARSIENRDR